MTEEERNYDCPECEMSFYKRKARMLHVDLVHTAERLNESTSEIDDYLEEAFSDFVNLIQSNSSFSKRNLEGEQQ